MGGKDRGSRFKKKLKKTKPSPPCRSQTSSRPSSLSDPLRQLPYQSAPRRTWNCPDNSLAHRSRAEAVSQGQPGDSVGGTADTAGWTQSDKASVISFSS